MINVGILGSGSISSFFVESAKPVEGLNAVGILSRSLEKAQAFSEKNHLEYYFDSYEKMLQEEQINTIYVALPNSLHYQYTMQAISAKKTVILEKPFVSNLSELDSLLQAAEENGVQLFELDRVLGMPHFQIIQNQIDKISPVRLATINYSQYSRRYNDLLEGKVQNVFSDEFSGGALVDLGVYSIHLITGLFGAPQQVSYTAEQLPNTIDISGNLVLKYDGMIASLIQSKNTRSDNKMTIQGEKGTIYISPAPSKITKVELDISGNKEILSETPDLNSTTATLERIVGMIESKDEKVYAQNIEHIKTVMEILVQARKCAGIVFKTDK